MKLKNIIAILAVLLSLSSCEEEIKLYSGEQSLDRITVSAVVTPDTVVLAYITEASKIDYFSSIALRSDYYQYDNIKEARKTIALAPERLETILQEADAKIIVNGKDSYPMTYDPVYCTYNSGYVPVPGDNITIRVESLSNPDSLGNRVQLNPAQATVSLPVTTPKIEILSREIKYKEKEYQEVPEFSGTTMISDLYGTDTVMTMKLKITDPGQENNFYRLLVRSVGSVRYGSAAYLTYICVDTFNSDDRLFYDSDLTKPYGFLPAYFSNVFDDKLLNGKEYEFTVETRKRKAVEIEPYVILELQELSPDLYYYMKDIEVFRISDFDLYENPMQINTNVSGGWGVFGAMTYDTHIVPFK